MQLTFRIGSEYEGAPVGRFRISVTDSEFPEAVPDDMAAILRSQYRRAFGKRGEAALTQIFRDASGGSPQSQRDLGRARCGAARCGEQNSQHHGDVGNGHSRAILFILLRGDYEKPGDKVTPGGARLPAAHAGRMRRGTVWAWRDGWWILPIR